jgi:hypothetical protein
MLDMLVESYKKMPSYRFEDVLEVYFGKRETAKKEDEKC